MNDVRFYILFGLFLSLASTSAQPVVLDVLIKNGLVYQEQAGEFVPLDIGIHSDSIYALSPDIDLPAKKTIDATGYHIAPGFIDTHTHALGDLSHPDRKANLNYLYQGVTTVVVGNDGGGPVHTDQILSKFEEQGIGTNAILMAGHGSIRKLIMGMDDRPPTTEELKNMKTLVARSMEAGAFGLSTGLYYAPNSFADTEEVIALARVAARYGGIYDSHLRDESSYTIGLINAVRELIRVGEMAGLPVNISHIKALGVDVWGQSRDIVQLVDSARAAGIRVTADQYPYRASGTSLTGALIPKWVLADAADFRTKFDEPDLRPKIVAAMAENLRRRGGAESLLLTFSSQEALVGKTLEQVAGDWGMSPVETAIKIIRESGSSVASFNMREEDIRHFMQQPWIMTCSDGSAGHPRKYGSYPQKISEYVLEKKVIDLPTMIRQSAVLPAQTFQIRRRGEIRIGYYADLSVFKPEALTARADFKSPAKLASGIHYLLVNGQVVLEEGNYSGALAGKALRRQD